MKFEIEMANENLDEIIADRLNEMADNMENYLHNAEVPLKGDIKDYKMLIKAANYFKGSNDQRKPVKFVAYK